MWLTVANIVDRLLALLDVWMKRKEQKEAQNERNSLEESPADFFNQHFGGVPKSTDKNTPTK